MNPWRSLGKMPREVWIVFSATLINRSGTMALPFMGLYIHRDLGYSETNAGLVLMAYGAGALVTSPLSGRLSDRVGARKIMMFSLLSSGALLLILSMVSNYWAIVSGVFIWAIAAEAFRPASLSIMSELVAPEFHKAAFALSRLAVNVGMSIGPAVGGFLALYSFKALFFIDAGTALLAGLVLIVVPWKYQRQRSDRVSSDPDAVTHEPGRIGTNSLSPFFDRRLLYFLAAIVPVVIVFFQDRITTPLFLVQNVGLQPSAYGLLVMINTLMIIVIEVPLNGVIANWSHKWSLALGSLLIGAGFGGLLLVSSFSSAVATVVVTTLGEMIFIPASSAYIASIAPSERRGEYLGLYTMAFNVAFLIAAIAGTQVLQRFGSTALWLSAFAFGVLSSVMFLLINEALPAFVSLRGRTDSLDHP